MDQASKEVLASLGSRIRKARTEQHMTQSDLAGTEYTKGYVSALERGAVRPSLKSLTVFANRLQLPVEYFLAIRREDDLPPDLDALQQDLTFQFNYIRMLIRTGHTTEALRAIEEAEAAAEVYGSKLPARLRYRIPYLRATAFYQQQDLDRARTQLERALQIVEGEQDLEGLCTVLNLLGAIASENNQHQQALNLHQRCAELLATQQFQDPTLNLDIQRNIATDNWNLGNVDIARDTYKNALQSNDATTGLRQQAQLLWARAMAVRAKGDWEQSKLLATRALNLLEGLDREAEIANIAINLAELATGAGDTADAAQLLQTAANLAPTIDDPLLTSTVYRARAALALSIGDTPAALEHAQTSITLAQPSAASTSKLSTRKRTADASTEDSVPKSRAYNHQQSVYASALRTSAEVAEQSGHKAEADDLYQRAIEVTAAIANDQATYEVVFSYAKALEQRGDHKQAMHYYRQAAQLSQ